MSGPRNDTETGVVSFEGGPFIHLQDTQEVRHDD